MKLKFESSKHFGFYVARVNFGRFIICDGYNDLSEEELRDRRLQKYFDSGSLTVVEAKDEEVD